MFQHVSDYHSTKFCVVGLIYESSSNISLSINQVLHGWLDLGSFFFHSLLRRGTLCYLFVQLYLSMKMLNHCSELCKWSIQWSYSDIWLQQKHRHFHTIHAWIMNEKLCMAMFSWLKWDTVSYDKFLLEEIISSTVCYCNCFHKLVTRNISMCFWEVAYTFDVPYVFCFMCFMQSLVSVGLLVCLTQTIFRNDRI